MLQEQNLTKNNPAKNNSMEILKENFSHCFDKNGDFDFDKFKNEISKNEIDFSKESYGMDWLGKSYARLLASDSARTLLKEDKVWNGKEENKNSENVLIKWDNLEVLKHLSHAYYEQVKMIYIDPPYNTGSDGFVYQDDRKFDVKEFSKLAWVEEEKSKRILDFVDSKSNSHSAWLTFMYPRLYIAKQLLKDDGVIFISIDDNEVSQLKFLMDEIFWEENRLDKWALIWENKWSTKWFNKIVKNHEYLLAYWKKSSLVESVYWKNVSLVWDTIIERLQIARTDKNPIWRIKFPKWLKIDWVKDHIFKWFISKWTNQIDIINEEWMIFKNWILKNDVILEASFPYKNQTEDFISKIWTWKKTLDYKWQEWLDIFFKKNWVPHYVKNRDFKIISSIIDDVWNSWYKDLSKLDLKNIFDNPKPTKLLLKIFIYFSTWNDIILDFFWGSWTTWDAVMQLNSEDWGYRKYIMVQLPELIDENKSKVAYDFVKNELWIVTPTIFEITKERLIRAAKKIQEEKKDDEKIKDLDFWFKIFETTPIWDNYNFEAEEFSENLKLFDETQLKEEDIQTLLTTWKTADNIALTKDLEKIDLGWYIAYYFADKLYLMDKDFETKNLKNLLEKIDSDKNFEPKTIIAFGYHFESKNLREIAENIKAYSNKKSIDIDFITRY